MKTFLSTLEAAKICKVTYRTVENWIYNGWLTAEKTPNGYHWIRPKDLMKFFRENKMQIPSGLKPKKYKILIVEDDEGVIESIKVALEDIPKKIEFEAVKDGLRAGLVATQFLPDLIILDIGLPGKDGDEVCREIKSHPLLIDTKIAIFTGHSGRVGSLIGYGVNAVLIKPIDVWQFQTEICKLLGIRYKPSLAKI